MYVHPAVPAEAAKKAAAQFLSLKTTEPLLLRALDLGKKYEYRTLDDAQVQAMKNALKETP